MKNVLRAIQRAANHGRTSTMIAKRRIAAMALIVVASLGAGFSLGAQPPVCKPSARTQATARALQSIIDSVVKANADIPGIALTVLAPRHCLQWSGASGVSDRTTRRPLSANQPTRIASNTKTYTAAAVLRLVEERRLTIDDPITSHLSERSLNALRRDGYDVARITVRHLLNHTSGLYDYAMDPHYASIVTGTPAHRWSRDEQVDSAMVWGESYGAPGTRFHYSDTGYILLGEIVERLTKQDLASAMRMLLHLDSLGLGSTWLETLETPPAGVAARAHQYLGETDTYDIDPSFDLYGGGGYAATTADMAHFTRALFHGGVFAKESTIETMTTVPNVGDATRAYGCGMSRMEVEGEIVWGHSGFWNTFSEHVPARELTVAATITQQSRSDVARALLRLVIRGVRELAW